MDEVTVSPKFQIVIPRDIRTRLKLKPGQKMTLLERDGVITAIPNLPLEKLRGTLKGLSAERLRDKEDRF